MEDLFIFFLKHWKEVFATKCIKVIYEVRSILVLLQENALCIDKETLSSHKIWHNWTLKIIQKYQKRIDILSMNFRKFKKRYILVWVVTQNQKRSIRFSSKINALLKHAVVIKLVPVPIAIFTTKHYANTM